MMINRQIYKCSKSLLFKNVFLNSSSCSNNREYCSKPPILPNETIFKDRSTRKGKFSDEQEQQFMNNKKRFSNTPTTQFNALKPENKAEKEKQTKENHSRLSKEKDIHVNSINEFYLEHKDLYSEEFFKKRNKSPMALLVAYAGTGYHGLEYSQYHQFPAIENDLEKALFKAGHILPSNLGDLERIRWSRSSRTDKGVHSLSTVISTSLLLDLKKFQFDVPLGKELCANINQYLPEKVKVLGALISPRNFDARKRGMERTYDYLVPQKYLQGIDFDTMDSILNEFIGNISFHNFTAKRNTYKALDPALIEQLKEIESKNSLNQTKVQDVYIEKIKDEEETDNNTSQKELYKPNRLLEKLSFRLNPKNLRVIKSFKVCRQPIPINGENWIKFQVIGESFITYQIRKMMGYFFAVALGYQTQESLNLALNSPFSLRAPVAPPHSLYLNNVVFSSGVREHKPAEVFRPEVADPLKEEFCKVLYPHIDQLEKEQLEFDRFFNIFLPKHYFGLENIELLRQLQSEFLQEADQRKNQRDEFIKSIKTMRDD
ncbi:hypothetical protein CYY_003278 [Polysphondylium violaceum]|uniref:Pseudouridine synthase I TruA alpha/beta domain-containing protein n=1 Tax=Polysphondylium violaceum TaxID=133409 RepID=A0A8J4PZX7_9MYCE|nr:hypothetical protein CYY_003278 [Polysphondylium violaceum]